MSIIYQKEQGIATIKLNRPEAYNSINKSIEEPLLKALHDCAEDDDVRVVFITGEGKAFCAGQDLREVTSGEDRPDFKYLLEKRYKPIVLAIYNLNKPVVVGVNGVAAGAGANIALAGDIIFAHEKASFIQAFSAIGLIPDSGGTYTLPRLVGRAKAMAYCMLGDKVTAHEAERLGMIYQVLGDDAYEATIKSTLKKLSKMPTAALASTKQLINAGMKRSLEEQLDAETYAQLEASSSPDYHEGVSAFIEKRIPNFTGKY